MVSAPQEGLAHMVPHSTAGGEGILAPTAGQCLGGENSFLNVTRHAQNCVGKCVFCLFLLGLTAKCIRKGTSCLEQQIMNSEDLLKQLFFFLINALIFSYTRNLMQKAKECFISRALLVSLYLENKTCRKHCKEYSFVSSTCVL